MSGFIEAIKDELKSENVQAALVVTVYAPILQAAKASPSRNRGAAVKKSP